MNHNHEIESRRALLAGLHEIRDELARLRERAEMQLLEQEMRTPAVIELEYLFDELDEAA